MPRRDILTFGAAAAARFGLRIWKDKNEQGQSTDRLSGALRGDLENSYLEINGKKLSGVELTKLFKDLVGEKALSAEQIKELMASYSDMVEVEADFGKGFNTLKILEDVEPIVRRVTAGRVITSNSFGPGQVNPEAARGVVIKYARRLEQAKILSSEQIATLSRPGVKRQEVVSALKLSDDESVVYGFLIYYDAYSHYGRDKQGKLHTNHLADSRAFSLAVAAYSAKLESPRGAKVQTYLNELLISNPDLRKIVTQQLSWPENKLLNVDGDLGKDSLALMKAVSQLPEIGVVMPHELELGVKAGQEERMKAMQNWLEAVRPKWRDSVNGFLQEESQKDYLVDRGALAEMVSRRYLAANKAYLIIKDLVGEEKSRQLYRPFVEERKGDFINVIRSKKAFEQKFPSVAYKVFIDKLMKSLIATDYDTKRKILTFDEKYSGCVQTGFEKAKTPVHNNKNAFERVVRAHDAHPNDPSRIGLYEPRPLRQKKANQTLITSN